MVVMHPGQFIQQNLLQPKGMSQVALARKLEVDSSTVSRMLRGEADITASMALKLEKVFDCSAEYWLTMQMQYNLQKAKEGK
jgi:addiction module HigA family antidote